LNYKFGDININEIVKKKPLKNTFKACYITIFLTNYLMERTKLLKFKIGTILQNDSRTKSAVKPKKNNITLIC